MAKISRLVEGTFRIPPPGVVFAAPASNEYDDILSPYASACDSLMFQPLLNTLGQTKLSSSHESTQQARFGYLISNFLQHNGQPSIPNQKMQLLYSIYISPPIDVVLLCDWVDAEQAAVPLIKQLRKAGLRCYGDFENPVSGGANKKPATPHARLRLLLLTASTGHLRPSHPLVTAAIRESPMSPLLFVLCSHSPFATTEEYAPQPMGGQVQSVKHGTENFIPSALLLDLSTSRGIQRFVQAVCHYLGHKSSSSSSSSEKQKNFYL